MDFHFLTPSRDDKDPNTAVYPEYLKIYTVDYKLDNGVRSGICSGKLHLSIPLRLSDYCSAFQAEVMAIYRAAQWILVNGAPFTRVSFFSDNQAAIRSLPGFMDISRIFRECRRYLNLLSGRFNISLIPGHCNVLGNCRTDDLARDGALLPQSSLIELHMPLPSFKLAFPGRFFRDFNLYWVNVESCSVARLTWPLMDRRRTNQLLGLNRDIISSKVAMCTGHCIRDRHAERMRLPFNDFCNGCISAKEKKIVIYFCQSPPLLDAGIDYLALRFFST